MTTAPDALIYPHVSPCRSTASSLRIDSSNAWSNDVESWSGGVFGRLHDEARFVRLFPHNTSREFNGGIWYSDMILNATVSFATNTTLAFLHVGEKHRRCAWSMGCRVAAASLQVLRVSLKWRCRRGNKRSVTVQSHQLDTNHGRHRMFGLEVFSVQSFVRAGFEEAYHQAKST